MRHQWLAPSLLVCLMATLCSTQESCDFLFSHQPLAELTCNPWPYIHVSNDTLILQCSINGPQSQDIPHAMWYMSPGDEADLGDFTRIHFEEIKYSGPTYSVDIGGGRKMVDLMLVIASIGEEDAGCYWCEIDVESSKCTFPLVRSSAFCLHEKGYYSQMKNCTSIPTNDTVACAGNQGDCVKGTVPSIAADEPSGFPLPTQTVLVTDAKSNSTLTLPSPPHSQPPTQKKDSHPNGNNSPSGMEIGLFAGVAVCFLLMLIIATLVGILVYMVKRRAPRQQHRTPVHPANSWSSSGVHVHETASVTSSNINLLQAGTTPPPTPTNSLSTELQSPSPSPIQRQRLTTHKLSFLGSRKGKERGHSGEGKRGTRGEKRDTKSHEFHYYYVLERPQYYNVPVLGMERVLSSGEEEEDDWEEVSNVVVRPPRPLRKPTKGQPSTEATTEPEYALPSPGYQHQGGQLPLWAGGGKERDKERPHVYKELEESTMEPKNEYTKLVKPPQ